MAKFNTLAAPDDCVGGVGDLGLAEFDALGVLASEYMDALFILLILLLIGLILGGYGEVDRP
jgi:hypothetical protein